MSSANRLLPSCEHLGMFCFLNWHFARSVRATPIHKAQGGPEAPITYHSSTSSSQEGTMHKPTKSPGSVFARVKLLYSYLCGASSTNRVAATRLPRDLFLKMSSHSPLRKETGIRCLEPKTQMFASTRSSTVLNRASEYLPAR